MLDMKMESIYSALMVLAEAQDIRVVFEELQGDHLKGKYNGLWAHDINGNSVIVLGNHLQGNLNRRNFVFAHELGHAILHKDGIDQTLYWDNSKNNEYKKLKEIEADAFAEGIIMGLAIGLEVTANA